MAICVSRVLLDGRTTEKRETARSLRASSFAYALFTFLSGRLKVPREGEDNAYAKLFPCVSTQISSFMNHDENCSWQLAKW